MVILMMRSFWRKRSLLLAWWLVHWLGESKLVPRFWSSARSRDDNDAAEVAFNHIKSFQIMSTMIMIKVRTPFGESGPPPVWLVGLSSTSWLKLVPRAKIIATESDSNDRGSLPQKNDKSWDFVPTRGVFSRRKRYA